jgi:hypothetical protein
MIDRHEFDRIKQSQAFAERYLPQRRKRLPVTPLFWAFVLPLFVVGPLLLFIGFIEWGRSDMERVGAKGGPPPVLVPGMAVAAAIYGIIAFLVFLRLQYYRNAPIEAEAAIVVSKNPRQRVLLEFEDGSRQEFGIWGNNPKYGQLGIGDAGVAFIQRDRLLAFDRV